MDPYPAPTVMDDEEDDEDMDEAPHPPIIPSARTLSLAGPMDEDDDNDDGDDDEIDMDDDGVFRVIAYTCVETVASWYGSCKYRYVASRDGDAKSMGMKRLCGIVKKKVDMLKSVTPEGTAGEVGEKVGRKVDG